jgi:2'-5' RNA ligase
VTPLPSRRTVVEVPVPALDGIARTLHARFSPGSVREPRGGAAFAHISIAGAFAPPDMLDPGLLSALAAACASVPRFSYSLRTLGAFAPGVMYLAPEPVAPFLDLMRRCAKAADPGSTGPPAGRSTPHATVAYDATTPDRVAAVTAYVTPYLPIPACAVEAHLVYLEPGLRTLVAAFPLGDAGRGDDPGPRHAPRTPRRPSSGATR